MFLCGSREYDELTLAEMLSTLAKVVTTLCRQGGKGQRATETVSKCSGEGDSVVTSVLIRSVVRIM